MVSPISQSWQSPWARTCPPAASPAVPCPDTADFHEHLAKDRARTSALYDELPAWVVMDVMNHWLRRGAVDSVDFQFPRDHAPRRESPFAKQVAGTPTLAEVLPVNRADIRNRLEIIYRLKSPMLPGTTIDIAI